MARRGGKEWIYPQISCQDFRVSRELKYPSGVCFYPGTSVIKGTDSLGDLRAVFPFKLLLQNCYSVSLGQTSSGHQYPKVKGTLTHDLVVARLRNEKVVIATDIRTRSGVKQEWIENIKFKERVPFFNDLANLLELLFFSPNPWSIWDRRQTINEVMKDIFDFLTDVESRRLVLNLLHYDLDRWEFSTHYLGQGKELNLSSGIRGRRIKQQLLNLAVENYQTRQVKR